MENCRPGVGCRFGCFLNGDSGLGRDGLDLGLNCGLGGLAPGPMDCENLGIAGVGGVRPETLGARSVPYEGVVGVPGNESRLIAGDERFSAR